jgi:hypothetical protein
MTFAYKGGRRSSSTATTTYGFTQRTAPSISGLHPKRRSRGSRPTGGAQLSIQPARSYSLDLFTPKAQRNRTSASTRTSHS